MSKKQTTLSNYIGGVKSEPKKLLNTAVATTSSPKKSPPYEEISYIEFIKVVYPNERLKKLSLNQINRETTLISSASPKKTHPEKSLLLHKKSPVKENDIEKANLRNFLQFGPSMQEMKLKSDNKKKSVITENKLIFQEPTLTVCHMQRLNEHDLQYFSSFATSLKLIRPTNDSLSYSDCNKIPFDFLTVTNTDSGPSKLSMVVTKLSPSSLFSTQIDQIKFIERNIPNFPVNKIWRALQSQNKPENNKLLWSEKYSPIKNRDLFLGYASRIQEMKEWLEQWKKRTDREAKQMAKQQRDDRKKKRRKLAAHLSETSDDDFHASDESNEASNDSLDTWSESFMPSAILLVGPSGVGKTCLVHTVAHDCGYQLFEVNGGSYRNRNEILHQLEQVMDSHHVDRDNKLVNTNNLFFQPGLKTAASDSKASNSQPNENDNSLIKKTMSMKRCHSATVDANTSTNHSSLVVKQKDEDKKSLSASLRVNSCSLILFDEVDVEIDEEDKKLWSTIRHFIRMRKRPIMLTANRITPTITENINGIPGLKIIRMSNCTEASIATYLHLISLNEGYLFPDIVECNSNGNVNQISICSSFSSFMKTHQYDIRACLQQLQLILCSLCGNAGTPLDVVITHVNKEDVYNMIDADLLDELCCDSDEAAEQLSNESIDGISRRYDLQSDFDLLVHHIHQFDDVHVNEVQSHWYLKENLYEGFNQIWNHANNKTLNRSEMDFTLPADLLTSPPSSSSTRTKHFLEIQSIINSSVFNSLSKALPLRLGATGNNTKVLLDYSFWAKQICQSENIRQKDKEAFFSNSLRDSRRQRFFHYFNRINLDLPAFVINDLCRQAFSNE